MKELPPDSKKTAGDLKSSGAPSRFSKAPAIQVFSNPGSVARSSSVIAVLMYPGDKVLTLIPDWPHSCANDRHICCTAAFEELYAVHCRPYVATQLDSTTHRQRKLTRLAICPDMDEINTILPAVFSVIKMRAECFAVKNAPVTLTRKIRSKSAAGYS